MAGISVDIQVNPLMNQTAFNSVKKAIEALGGTVKLDTRGAKGGIDELENEVKKLRTELDKSKESAGLFNKAFQFNQVQQGITQLIGGVSSLSAPFRELDTVTGSLRTLGPEAAKLAPDLREASIAIAATGESAATAAQLQQAMFDALASGVKGGKDGLISFSQEASKLATGSGATLDESVKLLTGNLNAYGKGAEDAGKFSDIFFNTINFGVTSAAELSNTLSNVVPTAAAAGVELENVGAALAVMTSKGVPTAQSTTKLNQLLLEIQKPGKELKKVLDAAGVSMASLKQDDLPVTLEKINKGLAATGMTATTAFSSSEASAGFNVLNSDLAGFKQTFIDVRDTTGSASNAYKEMSETVAVRSAKMKAEFEAFTIGAVDSLGGFGVGMVTVSEQLGQLAPTVSTLAGLGSIIPDGAIGKVATFAGSILSKLVPSLFAQSAATATTTATTTVADGATKRWNASLLLNPAVLIVAGLTGLVFAIKGVTDALHDSAEEKLEDVGAELKIVESQKKSNLERQKSIKNSQSLAEEYKKLARNSERSAEEQKRMNEISIQLNKQYPGLIDSTKSFSDNLSNMQKQAGLSREELRRLEDGMTALDKKAKEITQKQQFLKIDVAKEQIENDLADALAGGGEKGAVGMLNKLGNSTAEFVTGTSGARQAGEAFVKQYAGAIYNAKSAEELDRAGQIFQEKLLKRSDIKPADRDKVLTSIQKFIDLRKATIAGAVVTANDSTKPDEIKPPAPPPPEKLKDISDKIREINNQLTSERNEQQLLRMQEGLDKELAALDKAQQERVQKYKDDITEITALNKKGEVSDTQKTEFVETTNKLIASIEKTYAERRKDIRGKFAAESAKKEEERIQKEQEAAEKSIQIKLDVAESELKYASTLEAAFAAQDKIGTARLELLKAKQTAEIDTYITKNQAVIDAQQALTQAILGSDENAVTAARANLKRIQEEVAKDNTAVLIRQRQEKELTELTKKNVTDRNLVEINATGTALDIQRALRLAEIDAIYEAELLAARGNRALETDAFLKMLKDKAAAEEEYLLESNAIYGISLDIKAGLLDAFNEKTEVDTDKINKEKSELQKSEDELKNSLKNRVISYADYQKSIDDLNNKRAKLDKDLEGEKFDIGERTLKGLNSAAAKFAKDTLQKQSVASEKYLSLLDSETATEEQKALGRTELINQTVLQAGASLAEFATSQVVTLGSFANAAGLIALQSLKSQIPVFVAGIFGESIKTLGPILGPIASAGLTGVLYGLVSIAESGLQKREKGGMVWGGPQLVLMNEKGPEYTVEHKASMKNMQLLEHINKGGDAEQFYRSRIKPEDKERIVLMQQSHRAELQAIREETRSQTQHLSMKFDELNKKIGSSKTRHTSATKITVHADPGTVVKEVKRDALTLAGRS
jgi:TP901 family phage tail tape measure protein